MRRAWWIFAGSFFVLGLIAVLRLAIGSVGRPTCVVVALIVLVGFAAIRHRQAVDRARGRPARGGRIVRPDPVEPVALGLARCDPRRDRRRAGRRHRRRPHRRRAPPARCPRPRGDPGQRPAGRARLDDAPADRRPRGPGRPGDGRRADREPVAIPLGGRGRAARRRRAGSAAGSTTSPRAIAAARRRGGTRARVPSAGARCPRERQRDRRPDRRPGPPGLRPDRHAGRAADRRTDGVIGAIVLSHRTRGRLVGDDPAAPRPARPSRRRPPCRGRTRSGRPRRRPRPTR